jgi:hypothetical protein
VKFKDGTTKHILVGDGEGIYREEFFKGEKKSFVTQTVFIANGKVREIPGFK